jgi:hypothetical protein
MLPTMGNLDQCLCPEHDSQLRVCAQCDDSGICDECEYCWTCETSGMHQPVELLRIRVARAKGWVQASGHLNEFIETAKAATEKRAPAQGILEAAQALAQISMVASLELASHHLRKRADEELKQCLVYATHCNPDAAEVLTKDLKSDE